MNRTIKTLIFWVLIAVSAALLWSVVRSSRSDVPEISYSTFISQAESDQIARVSITGSTIEGDYRRGIGRFRLTGPSNPAVYLGLLQDKDVEIGFHDPGQQNGALQVFVNLAPLILVGAIWVFLIRQSRLRAKPANTGGGGHDPSGGLR